MFSVIPGPNPYLRIALRCPVRQEKNNREGQILGPRMLVYVQHLLLFSNVIACLSRNSSKRNGGKLNSVAFNEQIISATKMAETVTICTGDDKCSFN